MRKSILFILSILAFHADAQVNYVLNPSFEQYIQCPFRSDQIQFATYWTTIDSLAAEPLCSPEYCNECATTFDARVPNNAYFYHYPRTGKGLVQQMMYCDEMGLYAYKRDYMQGRLQNHLLAGQSYCVSFYVAIEPLAANYAVNHIGAYLDDGSIDNLQDSVGCASPQTQFTPQVAASQIIYDTNWTKIEGSFVANGTERFITIGNFFDTAHTLHVPVYGFYTGQQGVIGYSYYLVDDVSVIPSSTPAYAGHDTTIYAGDSAYIGRPDLMPDIKWHVLGNNTIIDSSAGFWAHPAQTTTYIVQQTLCSQVKYDTVKITVQPHHNQGISNVAGNDIKIYPNPAKDILTIAYATLTNAEVVITDIAGRTLIHQALPQQQNKCEVDIHTLAPGLYLYRITSHGLMVNEGKLIKE